MHCLSPWFLTCFYPHPLSAWTFIISIDIPCLHGSFSFVSTVLSNFLDVIPNSMVHPCLHLFSIVSVKLFCQHGRNSDHLHGSWSLVSMDLSCQQDFTHCLYATHLSSWFNHVSPLSWWFTLVFIIFPCLHSTPYIHGSLLSPWFSLVSMAHPCNHGSPLYPWFTHVSTILRSVCGSPMYSWFSPVSMVLSSFHGTLL